MSRPGAPSAQAAVVHGLSIDVEDYRQILATRFRGDPGPVGPQFERDMDATVGLLAAAGARATFFVLGTVARERPDLVRRWSGLGHEIGSHGLSHTPLWAMTPAQLARDLRDARAVLEDAAGRPVLGYRAPVFSVRWDTRWALDVIAEAGFAYDSSIVPVRLARYGVAGFPRGASAYGLASGRTIVEIPLSVARAAGRVVPVAGGGYFRLFSAGRIVRAVAEAGREGRPFVVYCHPDELGGERFRAADLARGWRDRLAARILAARSNFGRRKVPRTLGRLLAEFRFGPLRPLAEQARAHGVQNLLGDAWPDVRGPV